MALAEISALWPLVADDSPPDADPTSGSEYNDISGRAAIPCEGGRPSRQRQSNKEDDPLSLAIEADWAARRVRVLVAVSRGGGAPLRFPPCPFCRCLCVFSFVSFCVVSLPVFRLFPSFSSLCFCVGRCGVGSAARAPYGTRGARAAVGEKCPSAKGKWKEFSWIYS